MRIKGITDEDFINYKTPSMYVCTCFCDFKCDKENGESCCQNSSLVKQKVQTIPDDKIIRRYISNPITKAVIFAGLEPFEQFDEMFNFIHKLRCVYYCDDTVVIYTGFNKTEILSQVKALKEFKNIVIKFGRFIPNQIKKYDEILGIYLASQNQYAEIIS